VFAHREAAVRVRVFGGTLGCAIDRVVLIQTTCAAATDIRKQARAIFPHKSNRFDKLCPSGKFSKFPSSLSARNISLFQKRKSPVCPRYPAPLRRGVSRSSRHVGAGRDGRGSIAGRAIPSRRRNRVVLAPRRWRQVCRNGDVGRWPTRRKRQATEANKPGTPGRSRISRENHCAGNAGVPANLWWLTRVLSTNARAAAGTPSIRHSLRPPFSRGR
jgi:hypothetical protein